MVESTDWAGASGDVKVSSSFEKSSNPLTAQSRALGDLGGWGAHRGRIKLAIWAQVAYWD